MDATNIASNRAPRARSVPVTIPRLGGSARDRSIIYKHFTFSEIRKSHSVSRFESIALKLLVWDGIVAHTLNVHAYLMPHK